MGSAPWLRILGFRKEAAPLLSMLKKQAAAPVITKVSHGSKRLEPQAAALFEKHLNASELYRMVSEIKTGQSMKNEYTRSVIIL